MIWKARRLINASPISNTTSEMKRLVPLLLAFLIVGCDSDSLHSHPKLDSVLWMQTSAEYLASTYQSFNIAQANLEKALNDKSWSAALEQTGDYKNLPPAIIADVDETVLSNSAYQAQLIKMDAHFSRATWGAWMRAMKATALAGAQSFISDARRMGVKVFYVTNRDQKFCQETAENIRKVLDPAVQDKEVYCQIKNGKASADKKMRRAQVAKNHRVLLLLGDDYNDFVSLGRISAEQRVQKANAYQAYWGEKWILLSNPLYGHWERSLYDYDMSLSQEDQLQAKHRHLRTRGAEFLEDVQ